MTMAVSLWNTMLDSNSLKVAFYMKFFSLVSNKVYVSRQFVWREIFLPFGTSIFLHCRVSHKFTHTYCHSSLSILLRFPMMFLSIKRGMCCIQWKEQVSLRVFSTFFEAGCLIFWKDRMHNAEHIWKGTEKVVRRC